MTVLGGNERHGRTARCSTGKEEALLWPEAKDEQRLAVDGPGKS
jgi:hypothetical protein